ncbi:ATP-grasp domain-containing protein [Candidatus Bathyarchaeota archaeon]|nr:ATP-grasp domain-containing protein [Candidatus Bathyarchaeota archaeon]
MTNTDICNFLVIGVDTTFIAASAKSAGYNVYAVDYFDDVDLQWACNDYRSAIKHYNGESHKDRSTFFNPKVLLELAKNLAEKWRIDAVLLSSGLDDRFDVLCELNNIAPILGNSPSTIRNVREKQVFFGKLKELGIPHPRTVVVKSVLEAKEAAAGIGYPVVIKPAGGFGGIGTRAASNPTDIVKAFSSASKISDKVIVQKLIRGFHASISILAGKSAVKILSINEQLLGLPSVFQNEPFGYCGNIVPFQTTKSFFGKCQLIAEKIATHFGLIGSNGVDIVISKDGTPHVIEVNPRFQGTLGCVERVLGINLVDAHVRACLYDELPTIKAPSNFCTRLILYAPKRVVVPDLTTLKGVRNVPPPHSIIERGEPICSVLAEGESRKTSLWKATRLAKVIYNRLQPLNW